MTNQDHRTPGQLIASLLKERGWNNRVLAAVLEVRDPIVSRIVRDKRPVDAKLALMLEEVLGEPAERFLDLQARFDLALARIEHQPDPSRAARAAMYGALPIAEMNKRGWIYTEDIKDTAAVEGELCRFFKVNRLEDAAAMAHAAKKTELGGDPTPAQLAWFHRVRSIASEMLVGPYSEQAVQAAIQKLKPLRRHAEHMSEVPRILAEAGIRFVVVEGLPGGKIDGVCFWLDDRTPVIGMTLRFDRIDNFLFVLRHELEHVLQRDGLELPVIDVDMDSNHHDVSEQERIADEAATDFCVPKVKMDAFFVRKEPYFSERDLLAFAKMMKVHPGLVAGQIRRRTNDYRRFGKYLEPVRDFILPCAEADGWGTIHPI